MNFSDCYETLGLKLGASLDEVKLAYRRLARQYHPDINPDEQSKERFIAISDAYQALLQFAQTAGGRLPTVVEASSRASTVSPTRNPRSQATHPKPPASPHPPDRPAVKVNVQVRQGTAAAPVVTLSAEDAKLKQSGFQQLQELLKQKRYPRAVALAEGLAQRLTQDPEVRQWQAIAYQQLGRNLIVDQQFDKARIYLKKALKTDPHNRSLWAEVENEFRYLEKLL